MPIKPLPLPDLSILREMFAYDKMTGFITNRTSRTSRKLGERSEHKMSTGHLQVYACGRLIFAHRVAWALHYGSEPIGYIDHINGIRDDNRIENLRLCSHTQNSQNRRSPVSNSSGAKGVCKRRDKWRAYISVNRKRIYLGTFQSLESAKSALAIERKKLHGDFARD